jgi:hypothetical protein
VPLPIEIGAEFVHGEAPETERILREAGRLVLDIEGDTWEAESGRLRRGENHWEEIDRLFQKIDTSGPVHALDEDRLSDRKLFR